jgi:lipopolysaccharide/colanic/teichoic acid biosynthesis glycosyltransferase
MSRLKMPFTRPLGIWPLRLQSFRGLHRQEEMLGLIERERLRADRVNGCFALVVFEFDEPRHRVKFSRLIAQRVRSTDDIGLLREDSIGALLPDTALSGAQCFADSVVKRAQEAGITQRCQVFVYPTDWNEPHDNGHGSRVTLRLTDKAADAPATRPEGAPAVGGAAHACSALASLEPLLAKRLPPWKRATDIVMGSLMLVAFSPALVACALAVRCTSRGSVLFKQKRTGLGGRVFTIYKFRTMVVDAEHRRDDLLHLNEQDGPAFKIKNDPRVTRVGRILRKTSLDELPQLFNVLNGTMTLVGPRPLPCKEADKCRQWQRRRVAVTPGLTCIWQVKGRSNVNFDQWVRMDMQYIRSSSLLTDLKLLVCTVPAVLLRRGAH